MDFTELDKNRLDSLNRWAFGDLGGNGARADLKELKEAVLDDRKGLQPIVEKLIKQQDRRNYITMGASIGVIACLAFLAWQGNQQAQAYLELVNTLKDVIQP